MDLGVHGPPSSSRRLRRTGRLPVHRPTETTARHVVDCFHA
ncbi:hypothetical protein Rhow_006388 [Rhodococcus wratislaviensis]|uniref:Uncharacterized protein n=1 Tax=Rhodococcus wratislaviensis TaxID=44752 RepID=A0A402CFY4_RHOWR|nr:hypothetical protein Rhow_006388 [Rhodococcus wratislaviensis]